MRELRQLACSATFAMLSAGLVLSPEASLAQGASESAAPVSDDAIVVTARRREENLQSVPVAVTALSGEALVAKGIRDSADISAVTPGLYLGAGGFSSTSTNIALRGITTPGANISFDPSIGIYVDEVYLARNYGSLFDYFDLSGVEVLRGVQGTLFGRNNTGGAILLSTTKPKQETSGYVEAGLGNYGAYKLGAVVNLPLIRDLLAIRVGGQVYTRDGYGRDVNLGTELADARNRMVRASALLTPTSNIEAQVTYEYSDHKDSGPIFTPVAPLPRTILPGLGFYDVSYDTPVY